MPVLSATELERSLALGLDVEGDLTRDAGSVRISPRAPVLIIVSDDRELMRCTRRAPARLVRASGGSRVVQEESVRTIADQLRRRHGHGPVIELRTMEDAGVRVLGPEDDPTTRRWRSVLAEVFPGVTIRDTRRSIPLDAHAPPWITTWIEASVLADADVRARLEDSVVALGEWRPATVPSAFERKTATPHLGERVSARTRQLDGELAILAGLVESLAARTPIDAGAEQRRFLSDGGATAPEFRYVDPAFDLEWLYRRLQKLPLHECDDAYGAQLAARRTELALELRGLMSLDDPRHARACFRERFGEPDDATLARATRVLAQWQETGDARPVSAGDLKKRLLAHGRRLGNRAGRPFPLRCRTVPGLATRVDSVGDTVTIRRGTRFTEIEAQALAASVVGGVLRRRAHGLVQPLSLFVYGTAGSRATTRGLPAFLEERAGLLSRERLMHMAARVVAVHRMVHGDDFTETFGLLESDYGLPSRAAYFACQHVYQFGGSTEPALAFAGFSALRGAGLDDGALERLLAGVVGLDDLAWVPVCRVYSGLTAEARG